MTLPIAINPGRIAFQAGPALRFLNQLVVGTAVGILATRDDEIAESMAHWQLENCLYRPELYRIAEAFDRIGPLANRMDEARA